ncbi:MAG: LysR family transcriptional regulator [Eubacteriales bacterium]|nr:LysR family transcriptional regulator [Eubacteriales bacterium]MDD4389920.1 LysR family transcriptional regulator [Eubacteriales bacterium]
MEIRNLYTFLQVASMQNFTQAGHALGYSQSNVSAQIRQLEDEIGVKLFDRIGRSVLLTQYGREFIPYAQQIVSISEKMGNFMRSEHEMTGTLNIGMVESLFNTCFEPFIREYSKRFPKIKIDLTINGTRALQELMRKGLLDVACIIDEPLLKSKWMCPYEKVVKIIPIANSSHAFASKAGISLNQLSNNKIIFMEEDAPYSLNVRKFLISEGIEIESLLTMQSTGMAVRLVESGDYISFLPGYTAREAIEQGTIVILDILKFDQTQSVQIILHENKVITPQIEGFLEEAASIFDTMLPTSSKIEA